MPTLLRTRNPLKRKLRAVEARIGNTPLLPVLNLHSNPNVKIFAKAEWLQLSGSVKARAAFHIIKQAILEGELDENKILLDATSGNTGIAYATIGKALGISITLLLPENASKERKEILTSLGAEVIYTSPFGGTDEAQETARNLAFKYPEKYFYASQYTNENNWKAHYYGTAEEIISELPDITHFAAGLGTTGTFIGTSRRLKEFNPGIQVISLQPDLALHGLEGWKHLATAIVPKIYDPKVADRNIEVSTVEAYDVLKQFYQESGLLISPSSAANISGALQIANEIEKGIIVTVLPDNADKYSEIINQII
ncbi:MAG: cysteine synthase family protein [Chitinophagaceae bacterium]|nr:cysteine synthase family protein [Chitinophagaceae bacterium]MCW5914510.1 cysteine synthase family protein [Chitinophagaceae bacterium]MCZ2395388.1 cysteine synthase family protein [Chitinophagales bacterium]